MVLLVSKLNNFFYDIGLCSFGGQQGGEDAEAAPDVLDVATPSGFLC